MISGQIKNLRQAFGWSQQKLADQLGVSLTTVLRWEKGYTKPSPLALEKLERLWKRKVGSGDIEVIELHEEPVKAQPRLLDSLLNRFVETHERLGRHVFRIEGETVKQNGEWMFIPRRAWVEKPKEKRNEKTRQE